MFKIGDFSKICQVSVKALRHWDAEGLLKPAVVDPGSGYRYYTIEQAAEVNRILALRTMGLGLPQIRRMLTDHPTADDLRAMLRLKQAELEQELEQAALRLRAVEARLKQIETDGMLPEYEVALKDVAPMSVLTVRDTVPTMQALVDLLEETHPYARSRTGANLLAVFHDDAYSEEQVDIEVGFPIDAPIPPIVLGGGREMRPAELPGVRLMAATVHSGPWVSLAQGYEQLGRWISDNGYRIIGPGREVYYHIDWDDQQETTVTELQFPIE
jgi:DNA-binding transcriptional MerR regulator